MAEHDRQQHGRDAFELVDHPRAGREKLFRFRYESPAQLMICRPAAHLTGR